MPFSVDALIEQIAAGQRGLVTRAQLLEHGVTSNAIAGRVQARRLRPVHRGVYRVGPVAAAHAREFAAVLACGAHAVLSHGSAARFWEMLPDSGDAAPVEVTVRPEDRRRRPGIRVHRALLRTEDVAVREGIPVTTAARTVLDLAAVLASRELEQLVARAADLKLLPAGELRSLMTRYERRPGTPLLRLILETEAGPALTRSEAEERLLALVRKAQLPAPAANVRIGNYELDFYWQREQVVVEVDGFAFHGSARSFENDRRRDAWLAARGLRVMRVTWRQLTREPEVVLVRLAQALACTDRAR